MNGPPAWRVYFRAHGAKRYTLQDADFVTADYKNPSSAFDRFLSARNTTPGHYLVFRGELELGDSWLDDDDVGAFRVVWAPSVTDWRDT